MNPNWTKEKRFQFGALVFYFTLSVNLGVAIAVAPTAITIAIWPFSFQVNWNEWYWNRWERKQLERAR